MDRHRLDDLGPSLSTATLLRNGQVLMVGGYSNHDSLDPPTAELYYPATGIWTEMPMSHGRHSHTATLLPNGNVLIAGGAESGFGYHSSAELYEPDSDGAAPSITILHNANQILSFSWSGIGTLEQSDSLTPPAWHPAPIQDNPHVTSTTDLMKVFRIKASDVQADTATGN